MRLPNAKQPCKNCPFKKSTLRGWLGTDRMTQILASDSFTCHKNTELQCAGHMLIKGHENSFVRLAAQLGLDTALTGRELVFATKEECIDAHTSK